MTITSPIYQVLYDDIPVPILEQRLISLNLSSTISESMDKLSLTYDDKPIAFGEYLPIPPIGTMISVCIGSEIEFVSYGLFYVDSWELSAPPNNIKLNAKSMNFKGHFFDQQTKLWEKTTLNTVVESIASKHELAPYIGQVYFILEFNYPSKEND